MRIRFSCICIGGKTFKAFGTSVNMDESIYAPREDSFLLEKWVRKLARGRVLDIGCGSGILALAAKEKGCDVLAVDINPAAVEHCKSQGIDVVRSDLFENVSGRFNLIVFNPPYLPDLKGEDKTTARIVFDQGVIERFLKTAKKFLADDGKILLLFSSLSDDVLGLAEKYGYSYRLLEEKPLFFERLFVYALMNKCT